MLQTIYRGSGEGHDNLTAASSISRLLLRLREARMWTGREARRSVRDTSLIMNATANHESLVADRARMYLPSFIRRATGLLLAVNDTIWSNFRISFPASLLKMYDKTAILFSPAELKALHRQLAAVRHELSMDTRFYDYGHSYFYQSLRALRISGRRSTEARIRELDLLTICHGKKVLDLGSNISFLDVQLSRKAIEIDCVDINPKALEIGEIVAKHLRIKNMSFRAADYLQFLSSCLPESYDVVLLLSAHISFDRTDPSHLPQLLAACKKVLGANGTLIFEAHPSFFENRYIGVTKTFLLVRKFFRVSATKILRSGTILDGGRVVAYCEKR